MPISKEVSLRAPLAEISPHLGNIRETFVGDSEFTVAYIQKTAYLGDLKALNKLLEHLVKEKGIRAVVIEGRQKELNLKEITAIESKIIRKEAETYFKNHLHVGGFQYACLKRIAKIHLLKRKGDDQSFSSLVVAGKFKVKDFKKLMKKKNISFSIIAPKGALITSEEKPAFGASRKVVGALVKTTFKILTPYRLLF